MLLNFIEPPKDNNFGIYQIYNEEKIKFSESQKKR